jgi:hypothetical protein
VLLVDDGPYTYDPGADDLAKKGAKAAYLMARKNAEDEKKMRVKEAQRKKEDGEEAECAGYSDPHDLDRATEDDVGPQNPNEQQFDAAGPSSSSLEDSVATLSLGNENDTTLELDDSVLFWEVVPAGAPNSVVLSKGRTNKKTTK